MRRNLKKSDAVSEAKHRHGNSVADLQCACINTLIISITMHKKKQFTSYPPAKHQNTANLGLEKPVDILDCIAWAST